MSIQRLDSRMVHTLPMRRTRPLFLALALIGCGRGAVSETPPPGDTDAGDDSDAGSDQTDSGIDAGPTACLGDLGCRCGSRFGLDAGTLYSCNDDGPGGERACSGTCIEVDGGDDVCPCPAGNGTYCGEQVG